VELRIGIADGSKWACAQLLVSAVPIRTTKI